VLSQNQRKFISALQVKKYRQKYRNFTVEGEKMVGELLRQRRFPVQSIWGEERWAEAHAALLGPFLEKFNPVSADELRKISALSTPNAVLAVAEMPADEPELALPATGLSLYLDGIQDPGNMGAILRVADWFGLPAVFCAPECADVLSPKVVQAGMGAVLRVRTREVALEALLAEAGETALPVLGAVLGGADAFAATWPAGRSLLVIGNEGRGIGPATEALLTQRLSIPRHPEGGAESLNAAVATGILVALWQKNAAK
jgi:TrmH family RNA methyltransferase